MIEWWQLALVVLAGGAAGFLNAVIGSGTLITFPTLLALGVPPLVANVSNNIGLVPGGVSAVLAGRADLRGQGRRALTLASASLIGGLIGALLLLRLPPGVFSVAVPILIGVGCVLVVAQPRIAVWAANRRTRRAQDGTTGTTSGRSWWAGPATWMAVLCAGLYGGYFGAAQGVLLIGILGVALAETLPRLNVVKNVLGLVVNGVAAVIFVLIAPVDWSIVAAVAAGSIVGAAIGGRVGRKLPPIAYRGIVVVVGVTAIGHQIWQLLHR